MVSEPNKSERLTASQIARRARLDRATVFRYLELPGAPKADSKRKRDFAESLAWIEKQSPRLGANSEETKRIREALLRIQLEREEIEIAALRGRYVDKGAIAPAIAAFMSRLTADLTDVFEKELPAKCHGRTTVEITELMAAGVDRVLKRLKAGAAPLMDKTT